jgi:hypothetical protein
MFRILTLGDPEWVARIAALPIDRRDIHLDQRMLAPYAATYGWRAGLALTVGQGEYIIQPVLLTEDGQLRHAYNFGGPASPTDLINPTDHFQYLDDWAKRHGATNHYCTLNPFLIKSQLRMMPEAEYVKETVVMDLNNRKVRGTTHRLANKAQGLGYKVGSHEPMVNGAMTDAFKMFFKIYEETMERKNAADHWKFSLAWFQAFVKYVKPHLLLATKGGNVEAGCMMVHNPNYQVAYYHFAGSLNKNNNLGINHMMVLGAAECAKLNGARYLHLGGGLTNSVDDGLFKFKSGFSKLRMPIYRYQKSYGPETKEA